MEYRVRAATFDDRETIVTFNVALADETEDSSLDRRRLGSGVRRFLSEPALGGYYLAETEDGRIAGQLMITYEFSDWRDGPIWWFQSVYVAAEHRRRGVWRALYEHVRRAAVEAGAVGFRLYVDRENVAAQKTYQAFGMEESRYLMCEDLWT